MSGAGALRERVTFQRKTSDGPTTPGGPTDPFNNPIDGLGNSTGEFRDLFSVKADIREAPGKERIAAGQLESTRLATIRVWAETRTRGVTPADRLVARGAVWNIRSGPVQIDRAGRMLEFTCETGVAT
ncbi:phage head closure protein [Salipiger abyssi]|uniref:Phage head-tail adaptor, putative, SPP1 family n=1 Tax=Salipiger abyssi TaxID=1250539 RepID=A0A1P8UPB0_9RHOB|nr:phage head closure protein [Salipiger abyssi]APZ51230.1 phage head-tail adaptor, putative, SPP1 family [Salipiger abyssi]